MKQHARKRGAWVEMGRRRHPNAKSPRMMKNAGSSGGLYDGEKITVAIDPDLLECRVCCGPLKPPLFQVNKNLCTICLLLYSSDAHSAVSVNLFSFFVCNFSFCS